MTHRKIDCFKIIVSVIFQILLVIVVIIGAIEKKYLIIAMALFTLFLTFLPNILEKKYNFDYPSEFELLILVFLYLSVYLGEFKQYYFKFWWWDIMLHTMSGIIIGAIGFSLVYILNSDKRVRMNISPKFVALFACCFAVALGATWEIFEFTMDQLFGFNMQKSGLIDTMGDLIVDLLGAIFVSTLGYFWMKSKVNFFELIEKNLLKNK